MPTIDLTDDEHAAVTAAIRRAIEDDKFPRSRRHHGRALAAASASSRSASGARASIACPAFARSAAICSFGSGRPVALETSARRLYGQAPALLALDD